MHKINIVAHRGGRGPFMENSLPAFLRAVSMGIKSVEMDIRLDYMNHRFFLEHDFFHHPKYRKNLLSNVIPFLHKNIFCVIEIKTLFPFNRLINEFISTYNELFKTRPNYVQSFNFFAMYKLKLKAPYINRGVLCTSSIKHFFFKYFFHKLIKPKYYVIHKRHLKRKNIEWAKKNNYKVYVYVLNSPKYWKLATLYQVDGIITDYPLLLKKFIEKM